jgi:CIC family chloride channel protein
VVGVAGAFATIAFRQAISLLQLGFVGHSGSFVEMARSLPWTTRIWLPAVGGLAAGFLLLFARRHADKNAHTDYMEAVAIGDGVVPVQLSFWRCSRLRAAARSAAKVRWCNWRRSPRR